MVLHHFLTPSLVLQKRSSELKYWWILLISLQICLVVCPSLLGPAYHDLRWSQEVDNSSVAGMVDIQGDLLLERCWSFKKSLLRLYLCVSRHVVTPQVNVIYRGSWWKRINTFQSLAWIPWNLSFRYIHCTGQFTPKMKANAEPRLISSLVWIDSGVVVSQHPLESFFMKYNVTEWQVSWNSCYAFQPQC